MSALLVGYGINPRSNIFVDNRRRTPVDEVSAHLRIAFQQLDRILFLLRRRCMLRFLGLQLLRASESIVPFPPKMGNDKLANSGLEWGTVGG